MQDSPGFSFETAAWQRQHEQPGLCCLERAVVMGHLHFKSFPLFSSLTTACSCASKTSCATVTAFLFAGVGFANCCAE